MSADHGVHMKAKQHKCIALNSDYLVLFHSTASTVKIHSRVIGRFILS